MKVIDSAAAKSDVHVRLMTLVSLWVDLREMEEKYGSEAWELDILRDEISDAFGDCERPDIALAAALSFDLLENSCFDFSESKEYERLAPRLQMRLVNLHVQSQLDELLRHPTEYEIANQEAFDEADAKKLNGLEKTTFLKREYDLVGWRSIEEMNPDVIFDPVWAFPRREENENRRHRDKG